MEERNAAQAFTDYGSERDAGVSHDRAGASGVATRILVISILPAVIIAVITTIIIIITTANTTIIFATVGITGIMRGRVSYFPGFSAANSLSVLITGLRRPFPSAPAW